MKYNYVIFGSSNDYYLISYNDVMNMNNVKYLCERLDSSSSFLNNLYRLHTSPKTNKLFKLPFQKVWNKKLFVDEFETSRQLCFIFFARNGRIINNGIVDFLKKKYPESKFVAYYQDMVEKNRQVPIEWYKSHFDMLISFDKSEAVSYGMNYYPDVYSRIEVPRNDGINETDVYFLGAGKDRYDIILQVYRHLSAKGIKCDFYLSGISEDKRINAPGINYIDRMPYMENLQHIIKTKWILEVMQRGSQGYTLRTCEALTYGKGLLTNNYAANELRTKLRALCYFENPDTIIEKELCNYSSSDSYQYDNCLSPIHLLEFIEQSL